MTEDATVRRLIEIRKEQGMSQITLAAKMGTNRYQVLRCEAGRQDLSLDFVRRYAAALGLNTVIVFTHA